MWDCMVHIEKLSLIDKEAWLKNNDEAVSLMIGGHTLQPRIKTEVNTKNANPLDRCAKRGVSYVLSSDTSDDNKDISIVPGK